MARYKAPVYREERILPASLAEPLEKLQALVGTISGELPEGTVADLNCAMEEMRDACRATIPITNGSMKAGYGVDATRKAVACAAMTELIRQIKKAKGW